MNTVLQPSRFWGLFEMEPRTFRIKSVTNSSWIEFRTPQKHGDDFYFEFAAQFELFSGVVRSSTYYSGLPVGVFQDAAASWASPGGIKIWEAIDGELLIKIVGGRNLEITMVADSERLEGVIRLDTESLANSAKRLRDFFDLTKDFKAEVYL